MLAVNRKQTCLRLRNILSRRFLAEHIKIEDFKNPYRVDDEKRDEPRLAFFVCRFPEREPFPDDRPNHKDKEKETCASHKAGSIRRVCPRSAEITKEILHHEIEIKNDPDLLPSSANREDVSLL